MPRTLKQAKAELKDLGLTLKKTEFDEYRVSFGNVERSAYYTNDLDDAVETGLVMAQHKRVKETLACGNPVVAETMHDNMLQETLAAVDPDDVSDFELRRLVGATEPAPALKKGQRCKPGTEFTVRADRTMEPRR